MLTNVFNAPEAVVEETELDETDGSYPGVGVQTKKTRTSHPPRVHSRGCGNR